MIILYVLQFAIHRLIDILLIFVISIKTQVLILYKPRYIIQKYKIDWITSSLIESQSGKNPMTVYMWPTTVYTIWHWLMVIKNREYYKLKYIYLFFVAICTYLIVCGSFSIQHKYPYRAPHFMNKPLTSTSTYRVFTLSTTWCSSKSSDHLIMMDLFTNQVQLPT